MSNATREKGFFITSHSENALYGFVLFRFISFFQITMTILAFTLILLLAAYCAGLLGSLTGLGGGVVVIPVLTLGFGIDFHYAIGPRL